MATATPALPPRDDWSDLLDLALAEDIGPGDLTSRIVLEEERRGQARLEARSDLIICGLDVARAVFETVDPELEFELEDAVDDGLRGNIFIETVVKSSKTKQKWTKMPK